ADGLEPALSWRTYLAQVKLLEPGESSGYGRRFVAERPTWIGIVPVGYADGFRRDLTGTEVRVAGEPRRAVGTVSLDAFAAVRDPKRAARAYAKPAGGAPFALSERHGAWRVALDGGRTVDFTPLPGTIEDDLATRDFTINAIARPLGGGDPVDPFGGQDDLAARRLRAVGPTVFEDDPLRLLRAVRLEDELGFRLDEETERLAREQAALVTKPAG